MIGNKVGFICQLNELGRDVMHSIPYLVTYWTRHCVAFYQYIQYFASALSVLCTYMYVCCYVLLTVVTVFLIIVGAEGLSLHIA